MGKAIKATFTHKSIHIPAEPTLKAHCISQADSGTHSVLEKNRSHLGFIINCHDKWQNMMSKAEHSPSYGEAVGEAPENQ